MSDYGLNPALGIETSHRFVLLATKEATAIDDIVQASGCELRAFDTRVRIGSLDCGDDPEFTRINGIVDLLRTHPSVTAALADTLLSPTSAPPPLVEGLDVDEDWDWRTGIEPTGSNWALKKIRAPQAWSLNQHIRDAGGPLVRVAIAELGFHVDHPDLLGILHSTGTTNDEHGTQVAGIIGARFDNALFTEGVSPFVELLGFEPDVDRWLGTAAKSSLLKLVQSVIANVRTNRARVVNISLGHNWAKNCYGGKLCDPTGLTPSANGCNATDVRTMMDAEGTIAAQLVSALNAETPVMFVVAAGNDSGSGVLIGDACKKGVFLGLGNFPAEYSSPFTWAAIKAGLARDIIVAEGFSKANTRVDSSNSTPHAGVGLFAPGELVATSSFLNGHHSTDYMTGTSFAAPMISGAAAYLLSIEPTLTNQELHAGLFHCAPSFLGAGTATNASLDLFDAVRCLDTVRSERTPSVKKWLADSRGSENRVDMEDFRALRDARLYLRRELAAERRIDLNEDGALWENEGDLALFESFPRFDFTGDGKVDDHDVAHFVEAFEDDPVQHWTKSHLPDLLDSGDIRLVLRSDTPDDDLIPLIGATSFRFDLNGEPHAGDKVPADLIGLAPLELSATPNEYKLTTPLRDVIWMTVVPMCGDTPWEGGVLTIPLIADTSDPQDVAKGEVRDVRIERYRAGVCKRGCGGNIINVGAACMPEPTDPGPTGPTGPTAPTDRVVRHIVADINTEGAGGDATWGSRFRTDVTFTGEYGEYGYGNVVEDSYRNDAWDQSTYHASATYSCTTGDFWCDVSETHASTSVTYGPDSGSATYRMTLPNPAYDVSFRGCILTPDNIPVYIPRNGTVSYQWYSERITRTISDTAYPSIPSCTCDPTGRHVVSCP